MVERGFSGKSYASAVTMPAGGRGERLRGKTETAPKSHTLRGGCISMMMLDAKDVSIFPLRLVGIVKASAPLFPENPFAADGIIL
ncbi:hypothetical protein EDM56_01725 [Brevibacillus fluminis]|uniref:Uncharacterized protein n=1 Tax=Brevibacillus fluminis TaxID=511487 RepID=A0A3M8DY25_9BACL|nr:hypothetical protein EDM56_01725 [Brevibacillus fluminis]